MKDYFLLFITTFFVIAGIWCAVVGFNLGVMISDLFVRVL